MIADLARGNHILILEPLHPDALQLLQSVGDVVLAESLNANYIEQAVAEVDVLITRGLGQVTRAILEAGRKLRCVARCGVGTDNIDVAAATELGLPVLYAPGSTTHAVAEHTMLLMLAVVRRLVRFDQEVKSGNWMYRQSSGLTTELYGKTLGIVGLGEIGQRVAELGQAFEMRVIYWSQSSRDPRFEYVELPELLRQADVVSLHVELTPETQGLIDQKSLASMNPSSILINTARGEVVDEAALYEALKSGKLAGAGIDVINTNSPLTDNPLWELENLVVTPHVAALTDATFREMCMMPVQQIVRILQGEMPNARYVKNPEVLTGVGIRKSKEQQKSLSC